MLHIGPLRVPEVAVLAPMAGITDLSFRMLCKEFGAGLVYTELVSAATLVQGLRRAMQLVETTPGERPVGVQLFGPDPAQLAEAARWVEEHVACDFIDLNMGCPVQKVVSRGAGAAIMRDPALVERLVRAVTDAVGLPVTAKTRSGWCAEELNAPDVARAVEQGGGCAIAVHARTRAQRHDGPVDWALLAELKRGVSIPVLGNGGVDCAATALRMREATGVDAVMVGRGAIGNPWIFEQIRDAWAGRAPRVPTLDERLAVARRHLEAALEGTARWARKRKERDSAEQRAMRFVRGHLVGYAGGAPGERAFKRRVNDLERIEDVLEALRAAWNGDVADPPARRPGPTPRMRTLPHPGPGWREARSSLG